MWASCKPQKTLPACTHWNMTILSWKMAVHKGNFMSLFTRQSGGQRVLPSQDNEDTQQQFSHARTRSTKVFLPSFYLWCHSREETYQALSRFTVLQATGSWARAWERGYKVAWWRGRERVRCGGKEGPQKREPRGGTKKRKTNRERRRTREVSQLSHEHNCSLPLK